MTMPVIIPSENEQKQIVKFLDFKCAQIAQFIRNKRRLIQLLKEQKQIIINQAVMRGIDPDVKMKPSGVDWLGDIPVTWECYKLKRLTKFNPSKAELGNDVDMSNKIVFLPMEKVSVDGKIDCEEKRKVSEIWNGFTYFKRGDVVVAKITPCFENGKGALLDSLETKYGFGTTEFIIIRPLEKLCGNFLYYITMSSRFRKEGEEVMTGAAGQKRVPTDFMKNYLVALPSIQEQSQIVHFIKTKHLEIDRVIDKTNREIELIQEYRTRLISDVVTGKVDVRNIKVEDVADEELVDGLSSTEETPAYAEASAGREELEDSIENGK
jgi:type I restriction enzyme S subunit